MKTIKNSIRIRTLWMRVVWFNACLLIMHSALQAQVCGSAYQNSGPPQAPAAAVCVASSPAYTTKYGLQSTFAPSVNNAPKPIPPTPVITVKLVFHVINDAAGNGTWQSSGATYNCLQGIANNFPDGFERYSYRRTANYMTGFTPPFQGTANDPNIMDSRVRYEVVGVYFYNNQNMHVETNTGTIINFIEYTAPGRIDEGLPIIFNRAPFAYTGYASQYNGKPFVHTTYGPPAPGYPNPCVGGWNCYQHLRHEIGHVMGWWHTYNTELNTSPFGTPDFLSDVFPQNNPSCPSGTYPGNTCYEDNTHYSNNVMCLNPISLGNEWMSPLQMGRRIRNLHISNANTGSMYQPRVYVKEQKSDWQHPWLITSNEIWDFDIQMYSDIVVKTGNTLKITCKVAMATDGKITVEKGARLIIDGGEVTGWCKKIPAGSDNNMALWTGIELAGNSNQNQLIYNPTGYCANQGIVEIKNGGIISKAYKGINTGVTTKVQLAGPSGPWSTVFTQSGGIVIAKDALFLNNVFDIIFYKYQVGNVSSRITNCIFRTDAEIGRYGNNTQITPLEHIKLYQNWGLNIQGCTFENTTSNLVYLPSSRGIGIYTTDSHFNVDRNCLNVSCSNNIRCTFNTLTAGIYIDNVNPNFICNIRNSDFNNNGYGIIAENVYNLGILENNFNVTTSYKTGIYIYGSKYYNIRNNIFTGNYNAVNGIVAYESQIGAHQIYRNTMSGFDYAINAVDRNGGNGMNDMGLKMNCNVFNSGASNNYDIACTKVTSNPRIQSYQSSNTATSGFDFVRNLYGAPWNGSLNKFYIDPSYNGPVIIHTGTSAGADNPKMPFVQAHQQVFVGQYALPFVYGTHCPPYTSSNGGSASSYPQRLEAMNNYLTDLRASNFDHENDYEIQATVSSKLNLFLGDTLTESKDSVVAVLSANEGNMADSDIQLIFAQMRNQNFAAATELVNDLPNQRADWKGLLDKLITLEQDSLGIFSLLNNASDAAFIAGYANDGEKDGHYCAQAIMQVVFGTTHDFPIGEAGNAPNERIANLQTNSGIESSVMDSGFTIYPNPTESSVTLRNKGNQGEPINVEVKDVLGRIVFSKKVLLSDTQTLQFDDLSSGTYLFTILNSKSELIYVTRLAIQK